MTTTTPSAIIAKMSSVIEGILPSSSPSGRAFKRAPQPTGRLRTWALTAGGNVQFRLFEVSRAGSRVDAGTMDPSATMVNLPLRVTVVYPALPTLYGYRDLGQLEELIESDARQIRDALFAPGSLADGGHHASIVEVQDVDRADGKIWFQEFTVTAKFYAAQAL